MNFNDGQTTTTASRRRYTLVLLTALSALAFMDRQLMAILMEPIKKEFGLTDLEIGLISGLGFSLTFILIGVPLGRLADKGSRRNLLTWTRGLGGLLAALGTAAAGFWTLLVSRSGSAISEAGGGPSSISLLCDLYPPEKRSRVISLFGTGASIGALLSLIVGGWLAHHFGWRVTMAIVGTCSLCFALLLQWTVKEPGRHTGHGDPAVSQGAFAYLWHQSATRWLILGASFALLAGYGFGAWNNALLIRRFGLTLQEAGWISGMAALASILGTLVSGALADRLSRRHTSWQLGVPVLGLTLALPIGLAYLLAPASQLIVASALMVMFAFFIVWWAAPVYAALSFLVSPDRRASAHAVLMLTGAVVGNGLGPVLTGWMSDQLSVYLGTEALRFALMFMVCMLLPSMVGFWITRQRYAIAKTHTPNHQKPTDTSKSESS
jgi:MFS family permease